MTTTDKFEALRAKAEQRLAQKPCGCLGGGCHALAYRNDAPRRDIGGRRDRLRVSRLGSQQLLGS